MIYREDMLELTRRMTPERTCFSRIAGAYMDAEGYEDGTFNIHFLKLSGSDKKKNLELAKSIPFSKTNEELKEYVFPEGAARKSGMWSLLMAMRERELKDDGLLNMFYELMGEAYVSEVDYAIYVFFGSYDVPVKGKDKEWLEGSEEVYQFLVCAVSPLAGEYEPGKPEFGFLFPAFSNRCTDTERIHIFHADSAFEQTEVMRRILGQ
ncbi:MAG: DUF4317 family protein [Lachnospiraceae bacterium]|nr:DUF4317 family protein [Lachnospiraceae bacterium]